MPASGPAEPSVDAAPSPLALGWLGRLPAWARIVLALLLAGGLAATAYVAARNYPDRSPPDADAIEQRIAAVLSLPAATADRHLTGDFLVERFYALDIETGERYVGDLLKGRIQAVQSVPRDDGSTAYTLLLDLRDLQRDGDLYAAFVDAVAPPEDEVRAEYLGLRTFTGIDDAFAVNYSGNIPQARLPFRGPGGEDAWSFLLGQKLADVTASPRLVSVQGYNYLLSSTDRFPYFRSQFGVRALLLSELVVVDATAQPQWRALFRLRQEFPAAR